MADCFGSEVLVALTVPFAPSQRSMKAHERGGFDDDRGTDKRRGRMRSAHRPATMRSEGEIGENGHIAHGASVTRLRNQKCYEFTIRRTRGLCSVLAITTLIIQSRDSTSLCLIGSSGAGIHRRGWIGWTSGSSV